MRIGVIQASSQAGKNGLLAGSVRRHAPDAEVVNFGCTADEPERYTYVEIALLSGLLLASASVDLIVTGCSSGQGMMLACNSFPGVLCGYAPTPRDAYLFAQINNGNAVSLPLGEGYTWAGPENLDDTVRALFSEPFGGGYPKEEAARKLKDTLLLKEIRARSQTGVLPFLDSLDPLLLDHLLAKRDVVGDILSNSRCAPVVAWLRRRINA